MGKKRLVIILSLIFKLNAWGQEYYDPQIRLGLKADSVQILIGKEIQSFYNSKGWMQKMSAQTIDFHGRVKEIIFHKENIYMPSVNRQINCNIHFIMEQDTLASVVTQFSNLSFVEAKKIIVAGRNVSNMAYYYFNPDYLSYSHLYLSKSNDVIIEYKKTIMNDLPANVREQLRVIAGIW